MSFDFNIKLTNTQIDLSLSEAMPFNAFPEEMLLKILAENPVTADSAAALVCKSWNTAVKKLPDLSLKVYGKTEWEKYYGFVLEDGIPPLPHNIDRIAREFRRRLGGKQEAPTCSVFLIPKGLNLKTLKELIEKPLDGYATQFNPFVTWLGVFNFSDKQSVLESHWVLMTNGVIEGSRGMWEQDQEELLATKGGEGCCPPLMIDACVCSFMNYVSSRARLFDRDTWTYVKPETTLDEEERPFVVGGFEFQGLDLNDHYPSDSIGVAACIKFY